MPKRSNAKVSFPCDQPLTLFDFFNPNCVHIRAAPAVSAFEGNHDPLIIISILKYARKPEPDAVFCAQTAGTSLGLSRVNTDDIQLSGDLEPTSGPVLRVGKICVCLCD